MPGSGDSNGKSVSRRKIIQAIGATSAASLAGCLGDGGDTSDSDSGDSDTGDSEPSNGDSGDSDTGDSDMELGERFPEPLLVEYWSSSSATAAVEAFAPVVIEGYQNLLNTTVEYVPVEFTTQINNVVDDKRTHHVSQWWHSSTPSRLDPHEMTRRYAVDWAGGNGRGNPINYADCLYSEFAVAQGQAADQATRQSLVEGAQSVVSPDYVQQPLIARVFNGMWDSDTVTVPEEAIGSMGLTRTNPFSMIKTTPTEEDYVYKVAGHTGAIETTNYPIHDSSSVNAFWNTIFTSPLVGYSVDFDLRGVLAEGFESSNNGKTYTITIKEDATFHNGDDVTAEDVKFTYEQLWINGVGAYPQSTSPPLDTIEVLGDKQVEFNFEVPFPSLISREFPRWGVMHADSWQPAVDDPEGFLPDVASEVPGAGPFQIVDYELDEFISLEPHPEGHPMYDVDHSFVIEIITDQTAQTEALLSGEVDLILETSIGATERATGESDTVKRKATPGFTPFILYPQYPRPPGKFQEFREAIAMAVDRATVNEVAMRNNSIELLKSYVLAPNHPNYPDDPSHLSDQPESGDVEAGKQILRDAGWGWDDDGNLRYPADKDLAPRWPAEETPDPANYPCLNSEGEFEAQMSVDELLDQVP